MEASRAQLCRVGHYQLTGKLLGKGHFARVEEATHRLLAKTVAVKILDAALIQEEYARRHLQREPRVLARLRHPCIAMMYETMTCGSRLYLVMESCGGGDLCSLVLQHRSSASGLPESRARRLAAHLVSAVRHMHACGAVHRDLKMENIMLDITKQNIKIVDFGLSNLWESGVALRTPCGSLEYAAPELFLDGRRYGPEVDLWSVGVIVYGMVAGSLPFTLPAVRTAGGGGGGAGGDRPLFSQIIAKGFSRKQHLALIHVSSECRDFVKMLLQPEPRLRLSAAQAASQPWLRRAANQLPRPLDAALDTTAAEMIHRQIAEVTRLGVSEVAAQIRAEPYGALGGMYNIEWHRRQMRAVRPHTAQPPCAAAASPPPRTRYDEDGRLRHGAYLTSRSVEPVACPVRVERTVRCLPSITESQVAVDKLERSAKVAPARVKPSLRRPSSRKEMEQIGKYRPAAASSASSATMKLKDFYQRAGDCIAGGKKDYVDTSCRYQRMNTRSMNAVVTKRGSVGNIICPSSSYSHSVMSKNAAPVSLSKPKETLRSKRATTSK